MTDDLEKKGLIYVFTGDGKGKTTAALGVTLRTLLNKRRVVWISWYKSDEWKISEARLPELFPNIKMHLIGKGFFLKDGFVSKVGGKEVKYRPVGKSVVYDKASERQHRNSGVEGLTLARKYLVQSHPPDVLVMDEVLQAVSDGLVKTVDLLDLLRCRKKTHLVLTGRDLNETICEQADLVSSVMKVKHPYDKGILAIKGLDY